MVLNGVLGDAQVAGHALVRLALERKLCDLSLASGQTVGEKDDWSEVRRLSRLDDDRGVP